MDDRIIAGNSFLQRSFVEHVTLDQSHSFRQITSFPRVSDKSGHLVTFLNQASHEFLTDEAGSASDKDFHACSPLGQILHSEIFVDWSSRCEGTFLELHCRDVKESEVEIRVLVNDAKKLNSVGAAANTRHGEVRRKLPPLNREFVLTQTGAKKPLNLNELVCPTRHTHPNDTRSIRTEASHALDLCVKHGDIDFLENTLQLGESGSIHVSKKVKREVRVLRLNRFQVGPRRDKVLENASDSRENLFVRDLYRDEASN